MNEWGKASSGAAAAAGSKSSRGAKQGCYFPPSLCHSVTSNSSLLDENAHERVGQPPRHGRVGERQVDERHREQREDDVEADAAEADEAGSLVCCCVLFCVLRCVLRCVRGRCWRAGLCIWQRHAEAAIPCSANTTAQPHIQEESNASPLPLLSPLTHVSHGQITPSPSRSKKATCCCSTV